MLSLERRLAGQRARLRQAKVSLLPRISLSSSTGTSTNELRDIVNQDFSVWSLAANLLQPIFQGGRLLAGIDLADSNLREALETYAKGALRAFAEVETTLALENFLARREAALSRAVEQSQSARDLAEDRYARGLDGIITLLSAQRDAFRSESQLLQVQRLRLDARVDLHLALGGGFRLALGRAFAFDGGFLGFATPLVAAGILRRRRRRRRGDRRPIELIDGGRR